MQSPVDDKPVETAARQSVVEALVVQESTVEATVQEQVFENPVVEALVLGLVVEAPIVQESAVEATVKEQVFETQVVAEKVVEAAFTRESIIEDRVVVENPKAQESVIVETAITQASVAEIVTSQELVVESTAQEQVVETPVFEAPLVEEPIIEPQKVTYESTIESAIQPSNEDTPKSNETQEIIETEEMVISRIIPKRSPSRSRSPSNRKSRMGALGVEGKYSGTSTPTLQEERSSINADPRIKDSGNLEEQNEKIESVILKLESRKNSTESDPVESMNQNIENPLKLDRKNSDPAPELIKTASTEFETSIVETQGKKIVTEIKITTYELDNASPSIDQVNTIEKAVTQDPTDNENPDQVVQEETGNAEEDQRIMAVVLADFESQGEGQLSIFEGEIIVVLESEFGNGWSFGERMDGSDSGVFPSTYVHVIQQ